MTKQTPGPKPKPRRRTIRLAVIEEPVPNTRSVFLYEGTGTVAFQGEASPGLTMVCGKCGAPLVQGVGMDQIRNIVIKCNRCQAYNETLV